MVVIDYIIAEADTKFTKELYTLYNGTSYTLRQKDNKTLEVSNIKHGGISIKPLTRSNEFSSCKLLNDNIIECDINGLKKNITMDTNLRIWKLTLFDGTPLHFKITKNGFTLINDTSGDTLSHCKRCRFNLSSKIAVLHIYPSDMMHQRDIDLVLIAMVHIQAMLNKQHNRKFVEKHPQLREVHYTPLNTSSINYRIRQNRPGVYVGSGLGGFSALFAGGGCDGGGSCDGGGGGSSC